MNTCSKLCLGLPERQSCAASSSTQHCSSRVVRVSAEPANQRNRLKCRAVVAAPQSTPLPGRSQKQSVPEWAGASLLSFLINAAFSIPPVFKALRVLAKHLVVSTAEKKGVPWQSLVQELKNTPEVYEVHQEICSASIEYPEYYLQTFHTYDEGNLGWLPAFEAEAATDVVAIRAFKDDILTPIQAQQKLRSNIHNAIQDFVASHGNHAVHDIMDVGCGVGVSTHHLAQHAYPEARILGLDLSPYFLAVAELRRRQAERQQHAWPRHVTYVHGLAEATGQPSASFDIVQACFIVHEFPSEATKALLQEARRLLRPGGVVAVTDNDPRSEVIQNLPKPVAVAMKATEPWADQYYTLDMEGLFNETGFTNVETYAADPRHRVVLGQAM